MVMTRKTRNKKAFKEFNKPANVLQTNRQALVTQTNVESLLSNPSSSNLYDENIDPTSSSTTNLIEELDSFRLKWKRELDGSASQREPPVTDIAGPSSSEVTDKLNQLNLNDSFNRKDISKKSDRSSSFRNDPQYLKAKQLFLKAVELEKNVKHHDSMVYYKQAMHLRPDIENEVFLEQCEESAMLLTKQPGSAPEPKSHSTEVTGSNSNAPEDDSEKTLSLYERLVETHDNSLICCKANKHKSNLHISDLPSDLITKIILEVVGRRLDLASLDILALVSRGFFIMSRSSLIWRKICHLTWGTVMPKGIVERYSKDSWIDWRTMYRERARVNFNGVYISRTKYIRAGDVGFQDLTYRPFHMISYFRYIRFFPDKRAILLTTNEEPDKICPIFRHAHDASQFSPDLSVLDASYEFDEINHRILLVAEKIDQEIRSRANRNHRHQEVQWYRQTPQTQRFTLRFELKTNPRRPYRNNALKWVDYRILSRFEDSQEQTTFELTPDNFPNLHFYPVKLFNFR